MKRRRKRDFNTSQPLTGTKTSHSQATPLPKPNEIT